MVQPPSALAVQIADDRGTVFQVKSFLIRPDITSSFTYSGLFED